MVRPTLRSAIALLACAVLATSCEQPPPSAIDATSLRDGGSPRRILIDASRDGGVWWYPQWAGEGGFDPALWHQGSALADSLRGWGYDVRELPRPYTVTAALLDSFDIVIRAGAFGDYRADEIAAYQAWVREGGRLILLADHMKFAPPDSLGLAFGLEFAGVTRGGNMMMPAADHPVTQGVLPLYYMVGSGLVAVPDSAVILGRLDESSYLDLSRNERRDGDEPVAPAVFGVMRYGEGRIVFSGDVNLWERVPQPLVANVLRWLESS